MEPLYCNLIANRAMKCAALQTYADDSVLPVESKNAHDLGQKASCGIRDVAE